MVKERKLAVAIANFETSGLLIAILLSFFFLGIAALRPLDSFWSIDAGGKFIYMTSAIHNGNPFTPIDYPQRYYDEHAQFVPIFYRITQGDQFFTWWSPALPLMSIPFYLAFSYIGLYFIPAISGAACAYLAAKITYLLNKNNGVAWLVFFSVALATPVTFYSQMFWEHTPSIAALLLALFAILKADTQKSYRWVLVAGIAGSVTAAFRPEIILLLFAFGAIWLLKDWKKALVYGSVFLIISIPWMAFNYHQSGNLLYPSMNQFLGAPALGQINRGGVLRFFSYVLFNAPVRYGYPISRINLIIAALGLFFSIVFPFIRKLRGFTILGYLLIAWTSLQLLLEPAGYRAVHGFILISPVVLLGVWLFIDPRKLFKELFPLFVLGSIGAMGIAYILKSWEAAGGLQWGPRYLLAFYPLLVIAAAVGVAQAWSSFSNLFRSAFIATTIALLALGVGYEIRGIASVRQTAIYAESSKQATLEFDGKPMLLGCDANTLIPTLYWERPVFSILRSDLLTWANHLKEIGVPSYYQIDYDLCTLDRMDQIAENRKTNPSGIVVQDCNIDQYFAKEHDFCNLVK